jgi:hypothetical protein
MTRQVEFPDVRELIERDKLPMLLPVMVRDGESATEAKYRTYARFIHEHAIDSIEDSLIEFVLVYERK